MTTGEVETLLAQLERARLQQHYAEQHEIAGLACDWARVANDLHSRARAVVSAWRAGCDNLGPDSWLNGIVSRWESQLEANRE